MITNVLEGTYILNNKIDFNKIRHYWSGFEYKNKFNELDNNGYLSEVDYTEDMIETLISGRLTCPLIGGFYPKSNEFCLEKL